MQNSREFWEVWSYQDFWELSLGKWSEIHSVVPHSLRPPWTSPGQNTGMGSLSLLQGIFPKPRDRTQVSCIAGRLFTIYLSHQGSPRILEWVAYPFSRGSSPPRNRTRVSCTAGGFFTNWAMIIYKSPLGVCTYVYVFNIAFHTKMDYIKTLVKVTFHFMDLSIFLVFLSFLYRYASFSWGLNPLFMCINS